MERKDTTYSTDGTIVHKFIEKLLDRDGPPLSRSVLKTKLAEMGASEAQEEKAVICYEAFHNILQLYPEAEFYLELEVKIEELGHESTLDAIIVQEDRIGIVDHKTGYLGVGPDENAQLSYYALAAMETLGLSLEGKDVTFYITQPGNDEGYASWRCPPNWLKKFNEVLMDAKTRVENPKAKPVQGEWCQFCTAVARCPIYDGAANEVFAQLPKRTKGYTGTEMAWALKMKPLISKWLDEIKELEKKHASELRPVPGLKVVRNNKGLKRFVKPEMEAEYTELLQNLGIEPWEKTLLSPAKAEAAAKKAEVSLDKNFYSMLDKPAGRPTYAALADKREDISLEGLRSRRAEALQKLKEKQEKGEEK